MKNTKRLMTPEEVDVVLATRDIEFKKDFDECANEGYKSEICSCEGIFLANTHFVRCNQAASDCPMRSKIESRSVLEQFLEVNHE